MKSIVSKESNQNAYLYAASADADGGTLFDLDEPIGIGCSYLFDEGDYVTVTKGLRPRRFIRNQSSRLDVLVRFAYGSSLSLDAC
ncbi:MAG: hypothetical protein MZU97_09870 [Bacillus subtilis]|nr:hypothetical protein [Bacillus subtilis]